MDEVGQAADYCHLRGAKLYLALNTMMLEAELQEGVAAARQAYLAGGGCTDRGRHGAGGGACELLSGYPPACKHTDVRAQQGRRASGGGGGALNGPCWARELSLRDIREVTREGGIETEVFVHGALCSERFRAVFAVFIYRAAQRKPGPVRPALPHGIQRGWEACLPP